MTKHKHSHYQPLGTKLFFKEREKSKVTSGGLILSVGDETTTGLVTAVGPDVELVKVGDVIYLNWAKAVKVRLDGEDQYVLEEDELVAVLE